MEHVTSSILYQLKWTDQKYLLLWRNIARADLERKILAQHIVRSSINMMIILRLVEYLFKTII